MHQCEANFTLSGLIIELRNADANGDAVRKNINEINHYSGTDGPVLNMWIVLVVMRVQSSRGKA